MQGRILNLDGVYAPWPVKQGCTQNSKIVIVHRKSSIAGKKGFLRNEMITILMKGNNILIIPKSTTMIKALDH